MCDTAVVVLPDRVLFAKNSDRDPNEAQLLDWQPRARHPDGAELRCTWITIPQARETHAVLLSRPFWMWGAEMGANEHGVVIGNEAVFTRHAVPRTGLTGMDLLRLALERAATAKEAVETLVGLIARHPQGGRCGHEHEGFRYHSSFLVADPGCAYVLETAGPEHAIEHVTAGARSISNGLTIEPFATEHGDRLKTRVAQAAARRACSTRRAERALGLGDMIALLRDHGPGRSHEPAYAWHNGAMAAPCVHAGGRLAASQTTASLVSELRPDGCRHLATATAAPCTSLFKPVAVDRPLDLGPVPDDRADPESLWWRHEALHRRVLRDPQRMLPRYAKERDALEERWLAQPPDPADAFAEADRQLQSWQAAVDGPGPDRRPGAVRRYWDERNRRAGLELG